LDLTQGKMYWGAINSSLPFNGTITRANLDGSSPQLLISGLPDAVNSIALDLQMGKMYFAVASLGVPGTIRRANLDGSAMETLTSGSSNVLGLALDLVNGKIYWASSSDSTIRRANLDGSGVEVVINASPQALIADVGLDLTEGKLYWNQGLSSGSLKRANLDGSGTETVLSVSDPFGLALALDTSPTATPTETPDPGPPTATSTPTPTPVVVAGCPPTVDNSCLMFPRGLLTIKESVAGKEKLIAKLSDGPALAQTDVGNPIDPGGTSFSLCIYKDSGDLTGGVNVDRAGDMCGGAPCWKALGGDPPEGKGYLYKDSELAADGIQKVLVQGGEAGKSKALVKGKGPNLPHGVAASLQSSTSATLQLRGSDATQCLSLTLGNIKKQDAGFFKAN
jgi:hypothetical protein